MRWRIPIPWRPSSKYESVCSYRAICSCGASLPGPRQPKQQIRSCPKCGNAVFIFPQSPWPESKAVHAAALNSFRAQDWLIVIGAAGIAVVALLLVYRWFVTPATLQDRESELQRHQDGARQSLVARLQRAEKMLAEGGVRLA